MEAGSWISAWGGEGVCWCKPRAEVSGRRRFGPQFLVHFFFRTPRLPLGGLGVRGGLVPSTFACLPLRRPSESATFPAARGAGVMGGWGGWPPVGRYLCVAGSRFPPMGRPRPAGGWHTWVLGPHRWFAELRGLATSGLSPALSHASFIRSSGEVLKTTLQQLLSQLINESKVWR